MLPQVFIPAFVAGPPLVIAGLSFSRTDVRRHSWAPRREVVDHFAAADRCVLVAHFAEGDRCAERDRCASAVRMLAARLSVGDSKPQARLVVMTEPAVATIPRFVRALLVAARCPPS